MIAEPGAAARLQRLDVIRRRVPRGRHRVHRDRRVHRRDRAHPARAADSTRESIGIASLRHHHLHSQYDALSSDPREFRPSLPKAVSNWVCSCANTVSILMKLFFI